MASASHILKPTRTVSRPTPVATGPDSGSDSPAKVVRIASRSPPGSPPGKPDGSRGGYGSPVGARSPTSLSTRPAPSTLAPVGGAPGLKMVREFLHPSKTWQVREPTGGHLQTFDARWSPDDELIAAGYVDGGLRLFDVNSGKLLHSLYVDDSEDAEMLQRQIKYRPKMTVISLSTVTGLRWLPGKKGRDRRLAMCDSKGNVRSYAVPVVGKDMMNVQWQEGGEATDFGALQCLDWTVDGSNVIVAGSARKLLVLDASDGRPVTRIGHDDPSVKMSHSNRIFGLRCASHTPAIAITAAMDNSVMMWDLRAGEAVRAFSGPGLVMSSGDPVDISQNGDALVTVTHTIGGEVALWDAGGSGVMASMNLSMCPGGATCVQFSKDYVSTEMVIGTEGDPSCVFVRRTDKLDTTAPSGRSWDLSLAGHTSVLAPIWCADFAHLSRRAVAGSANGTLTIYSV